MDQIPSTPYSPTPFGGMLSPSPPPSPGFSLGSPSMPQRRSRLKEAVATTHHLKRLLRAKKGSDGDSEVVELVKSFISAPKPSSMECLERELSRRRDVAISRALGLEMINCLIGIVGHGLPRARLLLEIASAFGTGHFLLGMEGCDARLQQGLSACFFQLYRGLLEIASQEA